MQLHITKQMNLDELLNLFTHVPLKEPASDGSLIFPYKHASFVWREFHPDEVNPASFYVLRQNLVFQESLRAWLLKRTGIDTLHLQGAVQFRDDKGKERTLIPPVIELAERQVCYYTQPGEICYDMPATISIPLINDGLHRVMLARQKGQTFHGIFVRGADSQYPYYAHPNAWSAVQIVDSVPSTTREKKMYTRENPSILYRNFDVFGCGTLRPPGSS